MSEDKNSGKWASEVFDFIRLFKRTGSSFFGLFLLELGWILLLMLISRLYPVGDNPPLPTIFWLSGKTIQVSQLLLPGLIVVFLAWIIGSRVIVYLWMPINLILKIVVLLFLMLLFALIWSVNVLIFPISKLIEDLLIKNYLNKLDPTYREEIITAHEKVWFSLLEMYTKNGTRKEIRNTYGKKVEQVLYNKNADKEKAKQIVQSSINRLASREVALDEINFRAWFLLSWIWSVFESSITSIFSQANIGIAPIQSFSYEEEQTSIKLASQIFSTAIDWTRWTLKDIDAVEYVKFHILPEHIIPKDAIAAQKIKNWLNFDVLFWGSYITGSNKKIWINTSANLPPADNQKKQRKVKKDKKEERAIPELFLRDYKVEPFVLVIDHDQPWQAYAILVLALILTIQSRTRKYEKDLVDKLSNDGGKKIDLIIGRLIRDIFSKMPTTKDESIYPSIEELMIDVAGKWIGHKIGDFLIGDENIDFVSQNNLVFYKILTDCINRKPTIVENYYRAGMLACFAEREDDALKLFTDAKKYEERISFGLAEVQIRTDVHMAIFDLHGVHVGRDEAFRLSKFAAYVARAINILGSEAKQWIKEDFEKDTYYSLSEAKYFSEDSLKIFSVIQKLLIE